MGIRIALVTDTHLDHANCIEYDGRALDSDARIIRGLESEDYSVLVHLGDVAFGRQRYWHEKIVSVVHAKGAKAHLVLGNHDKNSLSWYYDVGWDWVGDEYWIRRQGRLVVLTHRPLSELVSPVVLNIHGHQHAERYEEGRICLHMPANHYRPYLLDTVLKRATRG